MANPVASSPADALVGLPDIVAPVTLPKTPLVEVSANEHAPDEQLKVPCICPNCVLAVGLSPFTETEKVPQVLPVAQPGCGAFVSDKVAGSPPTVPGVVVGVVEGT